MDREEVVLLLRSLGFEVCTAGIYRPDGDKVGWHEINALAAHGITINYGRVDSYTRYYERVRIVSGHVPDPNEATWEDIASCITLS